MTSKPQAPTGPVLGSSLGLCVEHGEPFCGPLSRRARSNRLVRLNHLVAGPEALRLVSLFDDTADVWSDEDFILVDDLSTVSRWTRPDEFVDVLLAEAA